MKIFIVYYYPTTETWYYLDKKLAKKTYKSLVAFERKNYPGKFCAGNVFLEERKIDKRVVFEPC